MGIVNITPDSFFDGGNYLQADSAIEYALQMVQDGAHIIDLGAESSRPGAEPVSEEEELGRLLPVIEGLRKKSNIPISVDTYKPEVARGAIETGADIINDISGGGANDTMLKFAAETNTPVILMHMRGDPQSMQKNINYENVVNEVRSYLHSRVETARKLGLRQIAIDPGIGFGKKLDHNLKLMGAIDKFRKEGTVLLLGASRKSFIGDLLEREKNDRLPASLAVAAWAVHKKVDIIRVHDVRETADVITLTSRLMDESHL